ncbi:MAG: Gfo/Idh/MocA family oxidoreductase [Actinomycetota bacterium]
MTGIAIIGGGAMARAHARAWSELALAENIRYVSTLTPGEPLAHAPRARFESDLDRVLADPLVTIVSVCTPTATHPDLARRALQAGKNVLLEKPIALTITEALELRDEATKSPGVLMVAHVVRFFDGYRAMRESVDAGLLGTVVAARAGRFSPPPGPSKWWHDESKSGGVAVDFSIHDFDQLNLFLGSPLRVTARQSRADGPLEATVDYAGGAVGQVIGSMGMPPGFTFSSTLELVGTAGHSTHGHAGALDSGAKSAMPDTVRLQTAAGVTERLVAPHNPYRNQAEYFLECVRAGSPPEFCPVNAAVMALAVALAARESIRSGRPVDVEM